MTQEEKIDDRAAELYHSESGLDDRKGLCGQLAACEARIDELEAALPEARRQEPQEAFQQTQNDWRVLRERNWDWHDQQYVIRPFVDALVIALCRRPE